MVKKVIQVPVDVEFLNDRNSLSKRRGAGQTISTGIR